MIIERHGGQISVSSDGTNGALFQFILPVLNALADDDARIASIDKHQATGTVATAK
jgi:signal transduction histidine kinase